MYLRIYLVCWALAFVGVKLRNFEKKQGFIRSIRESGFGVEVREADFRRMSAHPKFLAMELWAGFFLGSLIGSVVAGITWVALAL
jgi:hypothetical protein